MNAGIDFDTYLQSPFLLTLPTLDNITQKLVKENGKGSLF